MGPEGTAGSVGDWPSSYATPYQPYDPYGIAAETEGQGLPPMSSFRPNGTPTTTTVGPNNVSFGPNTDGINKALGTVSNDLALDGGFFFIFMFVRFILDLSISRTS